MITASLKAQILDALDDLSPEQQAKVLHFTKRLGGTALPPGIPGEVLLARAREINFDPEDLKEIAKALKKVARGSTRIAGNKSGARHTLFG